MNVPATPWNVRIETRVGDTTYYFHNTDQQKAPQTAKSDAGMGDEGIIMTSRRVCFASEWSYQNILKVRTFVLHHYKIL